MKISPHHFVRFIWFLCKHYNGFTIDQKFQPIEFFYRRFISDKTFTFRILQRAKGILFSPFFTESLEMLMFLDLSMEHHSAKQLVVILLAQTFSSQFMSKKAENFDFSRHTFDITHCPLRFLTMTLFFYKCICGIRLAFVYLDLQGRSNIPCIAFQCRLSNQIRSVSCFEFFVKIFHKFSAERLLKKMKCQINSRKRQNFARSACLKMMYNI